MWLVSSPASVSPGLIISKVKLLESHSFLSVKSTFKIIFYIYCPALNDSAFIVLVNYKNQKMMVIEGQAVTLEIEIESMFSLN